MIKRIVQFLREVRMELKKVSWPERREIIGSTMVVIITVVLLALFIGIVDLGLSELLRLIIR